MYIQIEKPGVTPVPYSLAQLRQENPQVSFPQDIAIESLARYGVYQLRPTQPPEFDAATQNLAAANPVFDGTHWNQAWAVTQAEPSEIASRADEQAKAVRQQRNEYLSASDWTQVLDAPLDATERQAWSAHRQALRDVTAQAGFPYSVEWPKAP